MNLPYGTPARVHADLPVRMPTCMASICRLMCFLVTSSPHLTNVETSKAACLY